MKTTTALPVFGTLLILAVPNLWAAETPQLKTQQQRLGYSIGYQQGADFKLKEIDLDADAFARGFKDAQQAKPSAMSGPETEATMQAFNEQLIKKRAELVEKNRKEGEAFLAENKKKSDVKTLPSGLQYQIIKAGEGKSPTINDTVVAHYRGTLLNGTEFDSSYSRKEPATFPLRNVIAGWQEALPLMHEGGKMKIFVPSNLAYGPRGAGGLIGPNATLIFDIELLSVKAADSPAK